MFADQLREKLSRSIKAINIPASLDKEIIVSLLKSAGDIAQIFSGQQQLIVTYDNIDQRNASLDLTGSFISENYVLQLEKPDSFKLDIQPLEEEDDNSFEKEFEVIHGGSDEEEVIEAPEDKEEDQPEPEIKQKPLEMSMEEAIPEKMENMSSSSSEETPEPVFEDTKEEETPTPVLLVEEPVEQVKEPVKQVKNVEYVETCKAKPEDPFEQVLGRKYLITFTMGWAVFTFIRSIF